MKCEVCGGPIPASSTRPRKFCSSRCKQSAYRAGKNRNAAEIHNGAESVPVLPAEEALRISRTPHPPAARSLKSQGRPPSFEVVPDAKWPGMYRVRFSDGTLSDMVNLARANDLARALIARAKA